MTYLDSKLNSKKIFLFIAMAAVLLVDLFAVAVLIGFGLGFAQLAVPLLLVVLDLAFIVIAVFTNFRFTYSLKYVFGYSALALALVLIFALTNSGATGGTIAMSVLAAIFWAGVHLLFGVAFASSVVTASADGSKAIFPSAFFVALAIFGVLGYGGFVFAGGVFGQGYGEMARTVLYEYDKDGDYYVAVGAFDGIGHELKVPEKFNGKPVGAVDSRLFTVSGIESVDLTGAHESLQCVNSERFAAGIDCPTVYISREAYDNFAKSVAKVDTASDSSDRFAVSVINSLVPTGFADNEVYITFSYTSEVFDTLNNELLPMWVGDKNEAFSLDFASDVSYVKKSDRTNESILEEIYTTKAYGGNILSMLKDKDGSALDGKKISASIDNVNVSFDPVYNLFFAHSNDALYNFEDEYTGKNGRYAVLETAADIVNAAPERIGFTLNFLYDDKVDLTEALTESNGQITVSPIWTMKAPTVESLTPSVDGGIYTYGDAMTITSVARAASDEFNLSYDWYRGETHIGSSARLSDNLVNYNEGGEYRLVVTSTFTGSSLSANSSESVDITVKKKSLTVTFSALSSGFTKVYDGEASEITVSHDASQVVADDVISYNLTVSSVKDAGEYATRLTFTGDTAYKYVPTVTEAVYTVTPKPLEILWSDVVDFVYSGELQHRSASIISGVCQGDKVDLSYSGFDKNVGEKTATLGVSNKNYMIKDADKLASFTVTPAPLTIEWNQSTLEMVYDGTATRKPEIANISGICKNENATASVKVIDPSKNVGTYVAKASLNSTTVNANYYIASGDEISFEITKKPLIILWSNTELTYNGSDSRLPNAILTGAVSGDDIGRAVTSNENAKDVGDYTATASISNSNYYIVGETSVSYRVKKAPVSISWGSASLTYNGLEQAPSSSIRSGIVSGESFTLAITGKYKDASEEKRTAAVSLVASNGELTSNYEITNPTCEYTIGKREVRLVWSNLSKVYNAEQQSPDVRWENVISGDDPAISVTSFKDYGEYTAEVTVGNPNYKLTSAIAGRETFRITKAPVSVSWSALTQVYDGNAFRPTASVTSGVIGADTVSLNYTGAAKKDVGSYSVSVSSANVNYYVTSETASKVFTVTPRPIEITVSGLTVTYNRTAQKPTVAVASGLIGSDNPGIFVASYTNAGTYENVKVSLTNANYTFADGQTTSFTFVIEKAPITVEWNGLSLTYNGGNQAPVPTLASGGFGDSITFSVSGAKKDAGGSYTASASILSGSNNYYISAGATTSFSILPKTVSLNFGTGYVYNGKVQEPSYEIVGKIGADDIGVTFSGCGKDAGQHSVSVSISNANYSLDSGSRQLDMNISQRPLTVTLDKTSFEYSGAPVTLTFTVSNAVVGENPQVNLTANAVDAGDYTATATVSDGNYVIANPTLSFKITKKALSVSWTGGNSYEADGSAKTPSASCKDVLGATVSGTVKYYKLSLGSWSEIASAPTEAGEYRAVFVPDSDYAKNYTFSGTTYEFTVEEASNNEVHE